MKSMAKIDPSTRLIRAPEVLMMIGYRSRDTLDRLRRDDSTFPKPVPLTQSRARNASIAWVQSEVQEWIQQRKGLRAEAA